MRKIEDIILEKLITGNNMDLVELCDELGYSPQQHGFMKLGKLGEKMVLCIGWSSEKATLEDLLKCDSFIHHINLYISNLNNGKI